MREISMKYRKRHKERPSTGAWTTGGTPLMTPSGFETPSSPNRSGEGQSGRPNKVSHSSIERLPLKVENPLDINSGFSGQPLQLIAVNMGFRANASYLDNVGSKTPIDGTQLYLSNFLAGSAIQVPLFILFVCIRETMMCDFWSFLTF